MIYEERIQDLSVLLFHEIANFLIDLHIFFQHCKHLLHISYVQGALIPMVPHSLICIKLSRRSSIDLHIDKMQWSILIFLSL